jgi:hypothetical protein
MHAYINEAPKRHVLASNLVVGAIMHVCAAVTRLREKIQKIISKEKSHKVVIFHVCVGAPLSNRLQWKFAHRFRSPT